MTKSGAVKRTFFLLFMLLFGIKRYFCGVKYDTNIKNNTLI